MKVTAPTKIKKFLLTLVIAVSSAVLVICMLLITWTVMENTTATRSYADLRQYARIAGDRRDEYIYNSSNAFVKSQTTSRFINNNISRSAPGKRYLFATRIPYVTTGPDTQYSQAHLNRFVYFGRNDAAADNANAQQASGGRPRSAEAVSFALTVDFDALETINPDVIAWLFCEGTVINYPVVQGPDNEKYLNRLFDGSENRYGCLFSDAANAPDFTEKNTVIYGHNIKDGSMFRILNQYKEQAFYNDHPLMFLITRDKNYMLELFAGYTASTDDDAWRIGFADDTAFMEWVEATRNKSTFQSEVMVYPQDVVVTLSTCTYEFDNARYIVVGRLVPINY